MKYVDEENGLVRTAAVITIDQNRENSGYVLKVQCMYDYTQIMSMERKMMHHHDLLWIGNSMNISVTADALDTNPSHTIFEAQLARLERENDCTQWPLKCKYKIFTLEFALILC